MVYDVVCFDHFLPETNMADNDIDYGPLTGLIGTWQGDKGMDVARTR